MKLDKVTITGADDSVMASDLEKLSEAYPFVEWGILYSKSHQGAARYPSEYWLDRLFQDAAAAVKLSAHLCGKWVRDLVLDGRFTWKAYEQDRLWRWFERVQINYHGQFHKGERMWWDSFVVSKDKQFILQHDGVNDTENEKLFNRSDFSAVPLFDASGGAGVLPGEWPKALPGIYCGYAGGLGPENLVDQIKRIEDAAGDAWVWIDMETRVRSMNDQKFDLEKVEKCLELAAPFVSE